MPYKQGLNTKRPTHAHMPFHVQALQASSGGARQRDGNPPAPGGVSAAAGGASAAAANGGQPPPDFQPLRPGSAAQQLWQGGPEAAPAGAAAPLSGDAAGLRVAPHVAAAIGALLDPDRHRSSEPVRVASQAGGAAVAQRVTVVSEGAHTAGTRPRPGAAVQQAGGAPRHLPLPPPARRPSPPAQQAGAREQRLASSGSRRRSVAGAAAPAPAARPGPLGGGDGQESSGSSVPELHTLAGWPATLRDAGATARWACIGHGAAACLPCRA